MNVRRMPSKSKAAGVGARVCALVACALAVPLVIAATSGICPTKVQGTVCFQGFPAACNTQTPPGGGEAAACLYVPTDTNANWGCTESADACDWRR